MHANDKLLDYCSCRKVIWLHFHLFQSRFAINAVTAGDYERPRKIASMLSELQASFGLLNLKNDSLRKRFDGLKYNVKRVEEVVYDLSIRGLLPPRAKGNTTWSTLFADSFWFFPSWFDLIDFLLMWIHGLQDVSKWRNVDYLLYNWLFILKLQWIIWVRISLTSTEYSICQQWNSKCKNGIKKKIEFSQYPASQSRTLSKGWPLENLCSWEENTVTTSWSRVIPDTWGVITTCNQDGILQINKIIVVIDMMQF